LAENWLLVQNTMHCQVRPCIRNSVDPFSFLMMFYLIGCMEKNLTKEDNVRIIENVKNNTMYCNQQFIMNELF
jgi:hypothetical protein